MNKILNNEISHYRITKKYLCLFTLCLLALICCLNTNISNKNIQLSNVSSIVSNDSKNFYISTTGNDNNDGTQNNPFKTFNKVRDEIINTLNSNQKTDINVYIKDGTYYFSNTLNLDFNNPNNCKIQFKPYKNDNVYFTGSSSISPNSFHKLDNVTLINSLPDKSIASNIYECSLENIPFNYDYCTTDINYAPVIYFNSNKMTLSRYPNSDYSNLGKVLSYETNNYIVKYNDKFIDHLSDPNIYINGYLNHNWSFSSTPIDKIDTRNKNFNISKPIPYSIREDGRFFLSNSFQLLDSPGEYYIDYKTKMLYLIPPSPIEENTKIQISTLDKSLVSINNSSNITIDHINFDTTLSDEMNIDNSNDITISNCTFSNTSLNGITINGGTNNTVTDCDVYNIGASGIVVNGGDRNTLTDCNHIVSNNHIHNFSNIFKCYVPGILINGVGITASNNKIYDSPHTAIMFYGNNNLIDSNEIYNVAQETDDVGAIYTGRDWTFRGNTIKDNYIHDIYDNINAFGAWGIYLDDCMCSANVYGNVFKNVNGGILCGGGSDHIIKNNTFVNSLKTIQFDDRGLTFDLTQLNENLNKVPYTNEIWSNKYPELIKFINDNPKLPKNNIITDNKYYNSSDFNICDNVKKYGTVENNIKLSKEPNIK